MAYSSYEEYIQAEMNMSEAERSAHFRDDYRDQSQLWPDYLDYLDEWDYLYDERLKTTLRDFIWHYLVKPQQRVKCGDHYHYFSNQLSNQGMEHVYIPTQDAFLDPTLCWYQTLQNSDENLRAKDISLLAPRLSVPESEVIKRATQLNLMLKDNTTHDKIDFKTFCKTWWNNENLDVALKIFHSSTTPMVQEDKETLNKIYEENKAIERLEWNTDKEENVLPSHLVEQDHGLHMLLRSCEQPRVMISIINEIRRRPRDYTLITEEGVHNSIRNCNICQHTHHTPYPTPTGIYYAAPGNGKSTAIKENLFLGIDTDWLNRGSTFQVIMKPFLDRNIAILTNQYDLSAQTGERIFGIYNLSSVRINPDNQRPYTSIEEVAKAKRVYGDDIVILPCHRYVNESLPMMLRMRFLSDYSNRLYLNKRMNFNVTRSWKTKTYQEILGISERWLHLSPRSKRAKRSKFKKKHKELMALPR